MADEPTRTAVAKAAGLRTLPRLVAEFDVTRRGAAGLRLAGRVSATVGQTCVVTLEPIDCEVEELIELDFVPAPRDVDAPAGRQVEVSVDDTVEPLSGDTIDLGAIATEYLILGIDPYPRKPDAVFEPPAPQTDADHPFAALSALRKGQGDDR